MPAHIESMVYVGQVPWHGLGKPLESGITVPEMVKMCNLDWTVETAPIVTNDEKATKVASHRVTRRMSDNAILGIVKKGFVPIQNTRAFEVFDNVIGKKAIIETGGSLEGGAKVWALAKLPGVIDVAGTGDVVEKYALLSNAHDGTRALQMLFTAVRVVCSNTLSLAIGDRKSRMAPNVKIRHNKNAEMKLDDAERYMAAAVKYYERFGDFTGFLAQKQLRGQQVKNIIAKVFPPNKQEIVTDAIAEHRVNVEHLFVEGKGHSVIAGSAWALINAFAEYADHDLAGKKKTNDARANSIWFGAARGLKQKATNVIVSAVS